jgi:hypothetical protein
MANWLQSLSHGLQLQQRREAYPAHQHQRHRSGHHTDLPRRSPFQPGPLGAVVAHSETHIEPCVSTPIALLTPLRSTPRHPSPPATARRFHPWNVPISCGRLALSSSPSRELHLTPTPRTCPSLPRQIRPGSTTSNKRPRSALHDTPLSRANAAIAEEAAASISTPIHHPEAQDDVSAMEEEELLSL